MTGGKQQGGPVARSGEDGAATGAIARRHDPDRFLVSQFVPAPLRPAAWTLIAFNHELARATELGARRRTGSEESRLSAMVRLQWWREVVEGERRRHEIAGPLGGLLDDGTFERAMLGRMIDAREIELEGPAADRDAWWDRLRDGPGTLAGALGALTGLAGSAVERCVVAGAAYGAGAALVHRDGLTALGRHPLPFGEEDAAALARDTLDRLDREPPLVVERDRRAAPLFAVLARRDLRRVVKGSPAPVRRSPGDLVAVIVAFLSGRVG